MNEIKTGLLGHLHELRRRLFYCVFATIVTVTIAFFRFDHFVRFFTAPFKPVASGIAGQNLFIHSVFEGFSTQMNLSILLGMILASPLYLYHFIRFLFPGLKPKERAIVGVMLVASIALAFFGVWLGYRLILPMSVRFLADYVPEHVGMMLSYQNSISSVIHLLGYSALAFQFPVVLEILLWLNLLSRAALWKASRFVILIIFIVAAAVTPSPDIVSQLGVALPMVALYFLTILVAKVFRLGED